MTKTAEAKLLELVDRGIVDSSELEDVETEETKRYVANSLHTFLCVTPHGNSDGDCQYQIEESFANEWEREDHKLWLERSDNIRRALGYDFYKDLLVGIKKAKDAVMGNGFSVRCLIAMIAAPTVAPSSTIAKSSSPSNGVAALVS